jgi:alpha-ribazole phosphatase
MRLSVIRHGMTEANEKRLYCGATDIPLSDQGRRGLAALRETLRYPEAELYVSSGMARASETLRILYGREPDAIIKEWMEMDFGGFEMKRHEELMDRQDYRDWIGCGGAMACPGGESVDAVRNRAIVGLGRLSGMGAGSAVAICHGGVIAVLMEHLFPGKKDFYAWQPDFGRGYTLDLPPGSAACISEI